MRARTSRPCTQLSDLDAFTLNSWLARPVYQFRDALQHALDQFRQQPRISTDHAIDLVWAYLNFDAYRTFSTVATGLIRADDQRRYVMDDKVTIMTPDGAKLAARLIRPRIGPATLPTLLEFTLGDDPEQRPAQDCGARLCGRDGVRTQSCAQRGAGIRARWRGCDGGHQLDNASDLERRACRHVRHAL